MKKSLLSVIMILYVFCTYSQTNTFPTNGNVGIGTTNPVSELDISNTGNAIVNVSGGHSGYINAALVLRANHSTNYRGLGMFMFDTNGRNEWFAGRPYAGSDQFVIYRNDNINNHADWSAATKDSRGQFNGVKAFFKISSNGSIGIGTINPDPLFRLSVNGKIRAHEIRVESNWADFVFKDDYCLRNLTELEEFINENGHLPDIPSEIEVKKNGISVGAMDAKLLQKIEELTLYVIEQQKLIQELQNKVNNIENVID